jgi:cytochrome c
MKKRFLLLPLLMLLDGCNSDAPKKSLDAKLLLTQKCGSCHNLDLPPKSFENEKAPPMMAVSFHIVNFMEATDENQRVYKAIEFVKDYVLNPDASKAFCDKKSLESYGVMPSQKGNVTEEELQAIATYMFKHFTAENLNKQQEILNAFNKMPKGEKIALKNNCLTCHRVGQDLVGPSFTNIAERYKMNVKEIEESIKNGTTGKWPNAKARVMPAFQKLSDDERKILAQWVVQQGS